MLQSRREETDRKLPIPLSLGKTAKAPYLKRSRFSRLLSCAKPAWQVALFRGVSTLLRNNVLKAESFAGPL